MGTSVVETNFQRVARPSEGSYPIGGYRTTVIRVVHDTGRVIFAGRCNCSWVDPRYYFSADKPEQRAEKHSELHNEGLVGPGNSWPNLQDPEYHRHLEILCRCLDDQVCNTS